MSTNSEIANNHGMNHEQLFEQAVHLAYGNFDVPSDDHILGIFARLVWNGQRGLDDDGAVTVH